jgi:hypothetical protein
MLCAKCNYDNPADARRTQEQDIFKATSVFWALCCVTGARLKGRSL